jgi:hypothetical protein
VFMANSPTVGLASSRRLETRGTLTRSQCSPKSFADLRRDGDGAPTEIAEMARPVALTDAQMRSDEDSRRRPDERSPTSAIGGDTTPSEES